MKRSLAAAGILAAAVGAAVPSLSWSQLKLPAPPVAPAATQPAGQADVPVKAVVLFSSGVGYFEHFGTVVGNGSAELRFKTDQINDVLKSLVLQDLDKGQVGTVSYPSQEPIAKTLKSFQVDITDNPPLAELLNQLRGARIDVALTEGNLRGTIVGVEKRQDPVVPGAAAANGEKPAVIEYWVLNLKVGSRFRSISLNQVRDFALEDPKLEEELDKALSALAQARDQEKKPVTISFRGQGERRVRMGYVVETPIWKTSYRLVLSGDRGGAKAGEKAGAEADGNPAKGRTTTAAARERALDEAEARLARLERQLGPRHPTVLRLKDDVIFLAKVATTEIGGGVEGVAAAFADGPATKPAEPRAAAPAELEKMREEIKVLKDWADGMDGQYGGIHPAVILVRDRQKAVEAAAAAGKLPPAPVPPAAPADDGDRKNYEDAALVLNQWIDGMEQGYGKDHPAVAYVRDRVRQIEKHLAAPANPDKTGAGGAGAGAAATDAGAALALADAGAAPDVLQRMRARRLADLEGQLGPNHPTVVAARQALAANAAPANAAGGAPPTTGPAAPGRAGPAATTGKLQGWAIVENQTDNDWTDVQLSLVSGRPLSFIQNLYLPLYAPRPVVYPNQYASLRPQTYRGGVTQEEEQKLNEQREAGRQQADLNMQRAQDRAARGGGGGGGGGGLFGASNREENAKSADAPTPPIDPTASVVSAASAAELGELFEYTVGSVSLARQKSAMIPIVTDDVAVERVSIYNAGVLDTHPLNGARVTNTTKKHLLQGPVTVLEAGTYAGDARIDDVPPGQSRLLSYGIDLKVAAVPGEVNADTTVLSGKIAKGVLELTQKSVIEQIYTFQNKGESDRTIIVEHPIALGYDLVQPARADEKTAAAWRFRTTAPAGRTTKLPVRLEKVEVQAGEIRVAHTHTLVQYTKSGTIPEPVRAALAEVVRRQEAAVETQRQIDDRKKQLSEVSAEQTRLRENMKTVAQNTDYYNRLLKKLDEQETAIEKLQKETADLQKTLDAQRKDLEAYVGALNVG